MYIKSIFPITLKSNPLQEPLVNYNWFGTFEVTIQNETELILYDLKLKVRYSLNENNIILINYNRVLLSSLKYSTHKLNLDRWKRCFF